MSLKTKIIIAAVALLLITSLCYLFYNMGKKACKKSKKEVSEPTENNNSANETTLKKTGNTEQFEEATLTDSEKK